MGKKKGTGAKRRTLNIGSWRAVRAVLVPTTLIAAAAAITRQPTLDLQVAQQIALVVAAGFAVAVVCLLLWRIFAAPIARLPLPAALAGAGALMVTTAAATIIGATHGLHAAGLTPERWSAWLPDLAQHGTVVAFVVAVLALVHLAPARRAPGEKAHSDQTRHARLQALQSRIRPHFLFNSMNSIAGMVKHDPERAERALVDLADVFRVLLADARKLVPIAAERDLANRYLDIEKIRLGDRLKVKWLFSNVPRNAQVPALTLQPLLENAVYHGIEPSFSGGQVKIEMWGEDDDLYIMISNPIPPVPGNTHRTGNHLALANIRERLEHHFGGRASLQTVEQHGNFHVRLRLPLQRGQQSQ